MSHASNDVDLNLLLFIISLDFVFYLVNLCSHSLHDTLVLLKNIQKKPSLLIFSYFFLLFLKFYFVLWLLYSATDRPAKKRFLYFTELVQFFDLLSERWIHFFL